MSKSIDSVNKRTNFTVAELISELQKLPQDLPVVVSGYKNGYEDFYLPYVTTVNEEPENVYHDGRFQYDEDGSFDVVVLCREDRL